MKKTPKRRSGEAMAALGRKAGPMRHRLEPRGGARNEDYTEEDGPEDGCTMRQDLWDDNVYLDEPCPRPVTHLDTSGKIKMCDEHADFYERYIGKIRPL